jgi:D-arabinose 1-dehydrogenase-like Zn-dependent alcohol dehydrogenase
MVPKAGPQPSGYLANMLTGLTTRLCGYCKPCLIGSTTACENMVQFGSGNHDQGGFATGAVCDVSALVKIPDEISSAEAGPLLCGGATVWGPLFQHGLKAGDRIGVVGIGGLGHLGERLPSDLTHMTLC